MCVSTLCCLSCLAEKEIDKSKNLGLRKKRGCSDVVCFIVFILVIIGYIGLGSLAYSKGKNLKPSK